MQVSSHENRPIGIGLLAGIAGTIFTLIFLKQGHYGLAIIAGTIGITAWVIFLLNVFLPLREKPFSYQKE